MVVRVVDNATGLTFVFRNHKDKEKFFDTWDETVVLVGKLKKVM